MWKKQEGSFEAKATIALHPTPKALRDAIKKHGVGGVIHGKLWGLPWNQDCTIGGVITSVHFQERDILRLHAILTEHAQDYEVWTAPDGTVTRRPA